LFRDTTTAIVIKCYGGVDGQAMWTAASRPLIRSERLRQRWKAVADGRRHQVLRRRLTRSMRREEASSMYRETSAFVISVCMCVLSAERRCRCRRRCPRI
jgi:hypothetical protein